MLNIGLTGGIGAGKSTVSKTLASLGAVIVDGDLIAREVVEPGTPGLAALVEKFGRNILSDDGSLNRPALAAIAFADDESRQALNSIVHPLVGTRRQELIDDAAPDAIVVQDIPLLVETGAAPYFALVVIVHVDVEERLRRLIEIRGTAEADARSRIAAQATDEQRRAVADVWLDNSGSESDLRDAARTLWTERLIPFSENVRAGRAARPLPRLVDWNENWVADAQRVVARLSAACGDAVTRIDHIGSTAVTGMPAKDVIDVQVSVRDLGAADRLREPLQNIGFPRIEHITTDDPKSSGVVPGEADPGLWQKRIHGSADPGRPVNVHLRVEGWPGQQFALAFRDWIRADSAAAQEYVEVKRRAESAAAGLDYPDAIAAYVDTKEPWFETAYDRVQRWIVDTGWTDG
ncbi:dephospho-CoA kinase [Rhodococcoides trifolii]|uniref:Dephospho-CoA kinase n=1 Tax=Rhodococcoides trifolii TaxID=908250 RepID=A0A917D7E4_9NOCA|nr:dephospho-CoA kinase [Rhodococcus trifolii]GGG11474.1 dephospho-CoA kinase [Rhodococcus trifolii]